MDQYAAIQPDIVTINIQPNIKATAFCVVIALVFAIVLIVANLAGKP